MGVATDLGYQHCPANPLQRLVQAGAGTRPGGWLFSRLLRHLDDLIGRLSKGQLSAPEVLAGLPVLDLTATGRTSGKPRISHLISIPVDDTLSLLGTNFGQGPTPAWVLNLEANPRATVSYRGRQLKVWARPATSSERRDVLGNAAEIYPGYLKYLERIVGREVRIFVLVAA